MFKFASQFETSWFAVLVAEAVDTNSCARLSVGANHEPNLKLNTN
jgi:hypothetical protein